MQVKKLAPPFFIALDLDLKILKFDKTKAYDQIHKP